MDKSDLHKLKAKVSNYHKSRLERSMQVRAGAATLMFLVTLAPPSFCSPALSVWPCLPRWLHTLWHFSMVQGRKGRRVMDQSHWPAEVSQKPHSVAWVCISLDRTVSRGHPRCKGVHAPVTPDETRILSRGRWEQMVCELMIFKLECVSGSPGGLVKIQTFVLPLLPHQLPSWWWWRGNVLWELLAPRGIAL